MNSAFIRLGSNERTLSIFRSGQPLEWMRIFMFFSLAIMVALISESLGLLLASRLSLIVSVDVHMKNDEN